MSPTTSRLIMRAGPNPGMAFELPKEVTALGRDVSNDIVLGDPEVSRQHARLTRTPGGYVLEDLGSTNGTFVNGERLVSPRVLNSGDLIALSEKVSLTFELPGEEKTAISTSAKVGPPEETTPQPAQMPPQQPVSQSPAYAAPEEEPSQGRSPWLYAGCGCLAITILLVGFLVFMDARYPDVLYGPIIPILRLFGF
jgi:hypothetical protein